MILGFGIDVRLSVSRDGNSAEAGTGKASVKGNHRLGLRASLSPATTVSLFVVRRAFGISCCCVSPRPRQPSFHGPGFDRTEFPVGLEEGAARARIGLRMRSDLRSKRCRALALAGGTLMQYLDSTITNVSLPTICGSLGGQHRHGTWIITAFAQRRLRAPDEKVDARFGRVRVFCISLSGL